jgi:hypothetical protein
VLTTSSSREVVTTCQTRDCEAKNTVILVMGLQTKRKTCKIVCLCVAASRGGDSARDSRATGMTRQGLSSKGGSPPGSLEQPDEANHPKGVGRVDAHEDRTRIPGTAR